MHIEQILIRSAVAKKLGADLEFYEAKLREFQKNPQGHGFHFEKLQGGLQELASIRLGPKVRAILCKISEKRVVVTDISLEHDYDAVHNLNAEERTTLAQGSDKGFVVLSTDVPEPVAEGIVESCDRIEFLNHQFIVLDEGQSRAKEQGVHSLPLIISGAPGSGKSSVLLSVLRQNIELWSNRQAGVPEPKILILAKSANLIAKMAQEWAALYDQEFQDDAAILSRDCVAFKTPEQIYKETHPNAACCGEQDFIVWYKQYSNTQQRLAKPPKGKERDKQAPQPKVDIAQASLIYQEFHSMSGYKTSDDYHEGVSQQFSLFPDKSTRTNLWGMFQAYKKHLQKSNQIDVAFEPIELATTYRFIGVDETQDLSRVQIRSLVQDQPIDDEILQHHNLLFNVGDHQRLFGSETTLPFIKTLFWERYKEGVTLAHEILHASYRCPKRIIAVANAVLQLKYKAIGGSIAHDKNELPFVRARDEECVDGDIDWLEHQADLDELVARHRDNAQFVVITSSEFLEEAQRLFGVERVFTAEQFKGLEANHVLLYKPLGQEGFQAANAVIGPDYVLSDSPVLGKEPDGSICHSSVFNQLFVAVTRAQGTLSLYQPDTHARNIRASLQRFCKEQKNPTASKHTDAVASTQDEWLAQADRLRQQGLDEQATRIEKKYQTSAPESQPEVPGQPKKAAAPKQAGKRAPKKKSKAGASSSVMKQVVKQSADDELLAQLLLNPEMVLKKMIQQEKGKTLLFHTPFKMGNSNLPFFQYLQTKAGKGFQNQFFYHFGILVQHYVNQPTSQKHRDVLAGLLYYVPEKSTLPSWSGALCQVLSGDPKALAFVKEYRFNRYVSLTNNLYVHLDIKSIHSLKRLEALDLKCKQETLLYLTVTGGKSRLNLMKALIDAGVDMNVLNKDGETALYRAATNGYVEAVQVLAARGADIDIPDEKGFSAVYRAVFCGHLEIIRLLLGFNAKLDVKIKSDEGTVLHAAAVSTKPGVISAVIDGCKGIINKRTDQGATALYCAVVHGNTEAVQILLAAGADVDLPGNSGYTPLHVAIMAKNLAMITLLLSANAKLGIPPAKSKHPIYLACEEGGDILRVLVSSRKDIINVQNQWGETALFLAAAEGNVDVVQALVSHGADINIPNTKGGTPLHFAVNYRHLRVVELLLLLNARVDLTTEQGPTVLHTAVCNGDLNAVRVLMRPCKDIINHRVNELTALSHAVLNGHAEIAQLLMSEADIHLRDKWGRTSLHYALSRGDVNVIRSMITNGADVRLSDACGFTGLHAAASAAAGHDDIVKVVLAAVANEMRNPEANNLTCEQFINYQNNSGRTAFSLFCERGFMDAIRLLIEAGADINLADNDNTTPLFFATQKNKIEVVSYLLGIGADFKKECHSTHAIMMKIIKEEGQEVLERFREFILKKGHCIDAEEKLLISPLEFARILGYQEIVELIEAKMREVIAFRGNLHGFFGGGAIEGEEDMYCQIKNV